MKIYFMGGTAFLVVMALSVPGNADSGKITNAKTEKVNKVDLVQRDVMQGFNDLGDFHYRSIEGIPDYKHFDNDFSNNESLLQDGSEHESSNPGLPFGEIFMLNKVSDKIEFKGPSKSLTDYSYDETDFSAEGGGSFDDKIDFSDSRPNLTFGWDRGLGQGSNWKMSLDLGVAFQSFDRVDLNSDGSLATDSKFRAYLDNEDGFTDHVKDVKPFIGFGITYKF